MESKPGDWHISSLAHIPELLALYCAEHFSHARIKRVTIDHSHQASHDRSLASSESRTIVRIIKNSSHKAQLRNEPITARQNRKTRPVNRRAPSRPIRIQAKYSANKKKITQKWRWNFSKLNNDAELSFYYDMIHIAIITIWYSK